MAKIMLHEHNDNQNSALQVNITVLHKKKKKNVITSHYYLSSWFASNIRSIARYTVHRKRIRVSRENLGKTLHQISDNQHGVQTVKKLILIFFFLFLKN